MLEPNTDTPHLIAHRGESFDAPENTMASFELAWFRGARMVETDVHLSRDGEVVLIHDDNTERTTGHDEKVSDQDMISLLGLDAGSWKGKRWTEERIPLLKDLIETVPPEGKLVLELKTGPEILPAIRDILNKYKMGPDRITFISFYPETMAALPKLMPGYGSAFLAFQEPAGETGKPSPSLPEVIAMARKLGTNGIGLNAHDHITKSWAEKIHEAGLFFMLYTVNDPAEARCFFEIGVDGMATDRCAFLTRELRLAKDSH